MDPALKAKWVEALRSGAFNQCQIVLQDSYRKAFCCLGVLCVVAERETDDGTAYPWLNKITGGIGPLVQLNDDDGKTFPEIADYIEQNL